MTCQSSESTENIQSDRRVDDTSGTVESDESRIALAMKDLKNTGVISKAIQTLILLVHYSL